MRKDLDQAHVFFDKKGKKLTPRHKAEEVITILEHDHSDIDISKYKNMIKILSRYFFRRYVVREDISIQPNLINTIDEFYFLLRKRVKPDIGLGLIEDIYIQRKSGRGHSINAFKVAYDNNTSFEPRKHARLRKIYPDGTVYEKDGSVYNETHI